MTRKEKNELYEHLTKKKCVYIGIYQYKLLRQILKMKNRFNESFDSEMSESEFLEYLILSYDDKKNSFDDDDY